MSKVRLFVLFYKGQIMFSPNLKKKILSFTGKKFSDMTVIQNKKSFYVLWFKKIYYSAKYLNTDFYNLSYLKNKLMQKQNSQWWALNSLTLQ